MTQQARDGRSTTAWFAWSLGALLILGVGLGVFAFVRTNTTPAGARVVAPSGATPTNPALDEGAQPFPK